jgi:hypothetical protein
MPDLEEAWALARDKPQGQMKFLRKYAAFTLGNDSLIWPHRDGLIWPRVYHAGAVVTV